MSHADVMLIIEALDHIANGLLGLCFVVFGIGVGILAEGRKP